MGKLCELDGSTMGTFWKLGHNTFKTFWEHQKFQIIKIIFKSTLELSLIISQNWFFGLNPKLKFLIRLNLLDPKSLIKKIGLDLKNNKS
jgi:hypothetical protein